MQGFEYITASSVEEVGSALRSFAGRARVIAGGTDLMGGLRAGIYPDPPEALVSLKGLSELRRIREEGDAIRIGAAVTLTELVRSDLIRAKIPLLAQAAAKTASRLLRNCGTLAGNICQENRCWYYRYPDHLGGQLECARKGGKKCFAVAGDSRYHSIFGAVKRCIAVNPSDTAPALMALHAEVRTNRRTISIGEFFSAENGCKSTVLTDDEVVVEVVVPVPSGDPRGCFLKFALRKSIDFPIVNCAVRLDLEGDRVVDVAIALNAVHCNPLRVVEAEDLLRGQRLTVEGTKRAAEAGVAKAKPFPMNLYKVQLAKTLVADAVAHCGAQKAG